MFVIALCLQNSATKVASIDFLVLCAMQLECMVKVAIGDDKCATRVK